MQSQNEGLQKIGKSLEEMMDDEKPKPAAAPAGERKPRAVPNTVTNRVYVGNLPWQTSWQDLKDHFRTVGEPVHASVFLDEHGRSKGCGIVEFATKDEALRSITELNDTTIGETGRLIFVREDREDRNLPREAREAAPRPAPARRVYAAAPAAAAGGGGGGGGGYARREHREPREHGEAAPAPAAAPAAAAAAGGESLKGRQVFVGNLPYNTSWQDLKDHFRSAGNVVRADILMLPNGRSKGQGTVLFDSKEEALKAIESFDGTDFQGRKIAVHEDRFVN